MRIVNGWLLVLIGAITCCSQVYAGSFFSFNTGMEIHLRLAVINSVSSVSGGAKRKAADIGWYSIQFTTLGLEAILRLKEDDGKYTTFPSNYHQLEEYDDNSIDLLPYLIGMLDNMFFNVPDDYRYSKNPSLSPEKSEAEYRINRPFFQGVDSGDIVNIVSANRIFDTVTDTVEIQFKLKTKSGKKITIGFRFYNDPNNPKIISIFLKIESPGLPKASYVYTTFYPKDDDDDRDGGHGDKIASGKRSSSSDGRQKKQESSVQQEEVTSSSKGMVVSQTLSQTQLRLGVGSPVDALFFAINAGHSGALIQGY